MHFFTRLLDLLLVICGSCREVFKEGRDEFTSKSFGILNKRRRSRNVFLHSSFRFAPGDLRIMQREVFKEGRDEFTSKSFG